MSRVLILMYHEVAMPASQAERRMCTQPIDFRRQMVWLKNSEFVPLSMSEIHRGITEAAPLPDPCVHVTFDDGFAGVLDAALPVLKQTDIPATLFALSGAPDESNQWLRRTGLQRRRLLSARQLRVLADSGIAVGSHTRTHPRLTELPVQAQRDEVFRSKHELEQSLGQAVSYFAYPYGAYDNSIRQLASVAGYACACTTRAGFNSPGTDPFQLRRVDVYGTDSLQHFQRKVRFGANHFSRMDVAMYLIRQLRNRLGRA